MKKLFVIILFLSVPSGLRAQWQQTNGPDGGDGSHLVYVSDFVFVNGGAGGIFRSADEGVTWMPVNNGLPASPHCYVLTNSGNNIYAAIYSHGIYYSGDFGTNWTPINTGISTTTSYALFADGQDIYAGNANGGFYYSNNHGNTWAAHEGVLKSLAIRDFVLSGNRLFAAVNGDLTTTGVYVSEDKGMTWAKLGASVTSINAIAGDDDALYVSGGQPLQISRDYGVTWESNAMGTTGPGIYFQNAINATGDEVYIGASSKAIFYSDDEGLNWATLTDAPDNYHSSILFSGDKGWLATSTGIYFSADKGLTWEERNSGFRNQIVNFLKVNADTLLTATATGLSETDDLGNRWSKITVGPTTLGRNAVGGIHFGKEYAVAGTDKGIYKSENGGENWVQKVMLDVNKSISVLDGKGDSIFATVSGEGIYRSLDAGEQWSFNSDQIFENIGFLCSVVKGDTIVLGAHDNIFISKDFGNSWEVSRPLPGFFTPSSVSFEGSSESSPLIVSTYQGIFKTVNLGENWDRIDDLPSHIHPDDLIISPEGNYYVGTEEGVYVSYNKGANWFPVNTGLASFITSLAIVRGKLFCGTYGSGVWSAPLTDLNVKPVIVEQISDLAITQGESISMEIEDFGVLDPDNTTLTLAIDDGDNYTLTGNTIVPADDFVGDLAVPVTVYDGHHESEVFNANVKVLRVVGTLERVHAFEAYPNPAYDNIYLRVISSGDLRITVVDLMGHVIMHMNASGTKDDVHIDLSGVATGLYLLTVQSERQTRLIRISKK